MGVLDDAIREHLDLKRRHGAAEEDLRRQEEEALGPARRDVAPAEDTGGAAEISGEGHDGEEAASPDEPVVEEAAFEELAPPVATGELHEAGPGPELEDATELHEPELLDDDESPEGPLEPKADHPPLEPAEEHDPRVHTPPRVGDTPPEGVEELDDDELLDEEDVPEDEEQDPDDVLEDTPEFLQETPEHDRLWFEQKPPRDFDFD